MRLLLVEDSRRLQRSLGTGLRRAGYAVDIASDGQEGIRLAEENHYAVMILDLMLPRLDGLGLLRRLRDHGLDTHVLVLTARDTLEDKLKSFQTGADDFLVKPFAFEELLARLQALQRRRQGRKNPRVTVGDLVVDTSTRQVTRQGVALVLPAREYALLEFLAQRAGHVVSRSAIEQHLYDGRNEPASNAVDAAVYGLRRRVDPEGRRSSYIETRRGLGYVLRAPEP
jgi:DNA-binding response OmpR family regulator